MLMIRLCHGFDIGLVFVCDFDFDFDFESDCYGFALIAMTYECYVFLAFCCVGLLRS